jgi:hypothetical protein
LDVLCDGRTQQGTEKRYATQVDFNREAKEGPKSKKYYVGTYRDYTMKKACIFVTTARDCIPASAITVYSVTANSQKEAVAWYKNLLKRAGYDS